MDAQMLMLGVPVTAGFVGWAALSQPKIKCWVSDKLKLHQFFQKHPDLDFRRPAARRQEALVPEGWTIGKYESIGATNFAAPLIAKGCFIVAISTKTGAGSCFAHILISDTPRQKDEATSFYPIGEGETAGFGSTTTSPAGAPKRYSKLLHLSALCSPQEALRSPEFQALQLAHDKNLRLTIEAFSISNDALLPQYKFGQFDESVNCLMTSTPTIKKAESVTIPALKVETGKVFYLKDGD